MDDERGTGMEAAVEPFELFRHWMDDAKSSEPNDPNAMSLATVGPEGRPSLRIVLMKRLDDRGFSFYTNGESRKGEELRSHSAVALCFHWKSRQRQIRVEGTVTELPTADADAYFKRRHRMSQIGAWASQQSRPLESRAELERRTAEFETRFPDEVPRPPYWTGFVVWPHTVEFWQEGDHRLHDRYVFSRMGDAWGKQRLYP